MIAIKIDDRKVRDALGRLIEAGADPVPALQEAGEYLLVATKNRFASQRAPDGTPWQPLSPVTIARKGHDRILKGETGLLSTQFNYHIEGSNTLVFGSTREYAATHQFGAPRGSFGQTAAGVPIPWGDIPARPFLGLSGDDEDTILEIIADYLTA